MRGLKQAVLMFWTGPQAPIQCSSHP
ncbi:uncharacterized protein METZ01_LOCUS397872 [marine metagenome]|uniref:Uncharacterized protein n=1 Tax=marine metagenome TaxID=408172 RepID=A0A382VGJ8_9ZZZZ